MTSNVLKIRAIVLKKTKLAEADLIFTLLAKDGQQYQVVGKGARRPGNSFSTRVEIFSELDCMFAKGKNLDILREVKLLKSHEAFRKNFEINPYAYCAVELMFKITDPGNFNENYYPLLATYLSVLERTQGVYCAKILFCSFLLKTIIFSGVYPHLKSCVNCGKYLDKSCLSFSGKINMSIEMGGYVCESCRTDYKIYSITQTYLNSVKKLVFSKFEDLIYLNKPQISVIDNCICVLYKWLQYHFSISLKSFKFV